MYNQSRGVWPMRSKSADPGDATGGVGVGMVEDGSWHQPGHQAALPPSRVSQEAFRWRYHMQSLVK